MERSGHLHGTANPAEVWADADGYAGHGGKTLPGLTVPHIYTAILTVSINIFTGPFIILPLIASCPALGNFVRDTAAHGGF
ncbi:hypothetical protein J6590_001878, partial [Homalodisca vitripennis]